MDKLQAALTGTPFWVWIFLVYLLIKGYRASQDQLAHIYRLMVIPVIFLILAIHSLALIPLDFLRTLSFIIAGIAGIGIGFWQISRLFLQVDKKLKLIHTPGSWIPMVLIIVIFGSKYYFGYTLSTTPNITHSLLFVYSLLIITGICAGMFIGRTACYICRYMSLPHQDLSGLTAQGQPSQ